MLLKIWASLLYIYFSVQITLLLLFFWPIDKHLQGRAFVIDSCYQKSKNRGFREKFDFPLPSVSAKVFCNDQNGWIVKHLDGCSSC